MNTPTDESDRRAFEAAWQPIETAPKHYKPILACNPDKGYEAIVVHNGAEWELLSHDGFPMGIGFYPTHWMPLPKPPEATTAPKPFTFADPNAQREWERQRREGK